MASALESLDTKLSELLSDWSIATTLLALTIAALLAYPILFPSEPDTHPLLLARQSSAAPIRHKGSSAAYRSPEVPYGSPLRSGLNVRDAGAPRWASGKDGDVRDIWREVLRGGSSGDDGKPVPKGKILTVLGKEEVVEHDVNDLTKEVVIIGKHLQRAGAQRLAIYLPNSAEYLLTVFACSFYGMSPILLPYNLPHAKVYELINSANADALVCAAGNLPLDDVASSCKNLKVLTWVVEKTSRHMDWNGVPDSAADHLKVIVWHDVVAEQKAAANGELPSNEQGAVPKEIISIWQSSDLTAKPIITTFTQQNVVAATSALISALPLRQRFTAADLVLPAASFTQTYILCNTFAALFTHTSLAITSVASAGVDLHLASRGVNPTVVLASAETMLALHKKATSASAGTLGGLRRYISEQNLEAGQMPGNGILFRLLGPSGSASGNAPGKLRLILTSDRLGAGSPPLSSSMLSDLRIFTRARICYALAAPQVTGAVAQSHVFDYQVNPGKGCAPFGSPLSSVEVTLMNTDEKTLNQKEPVGKLVVSGPSVSGEKAELGVQALVKEDGRLCYA